MVRFIVGISTLFIFTSCLGYRNEFGMKRFKGDVSKIQLSDRGKVCNELDTNKVYETFSTFSFANNNYVSNVRKRYFKFYADGKVGVFYQFNDNDKKTLDPKRADMGYFGCTDEKVIIQVYLDSPQSSGHVKQEYTVKKKSDTILELQSKDYIESFKILNLSNEFLTYKPDW